MTTAVRDADDLVAVLSRLTERRAFWAVMCLPVLRPDAPFVAQVDTAVPGADWQVSATGKTVDEALILANDEAERRERAHLEEGGELLYSGDGSEGDEP